MQLLVLPRAVDQGMPQTGHGRVFEKNLSLDSLMSTLLAKARDHNTSVRELRLHATRGEFMPFSRACLPTMI